MLSYGGRPVGATAPQRGAPPPRQHRGQPEGMVQANAQQPQAELLRSLHPRIPLRCSRPAGSHSSQNCPKAQRPEGPKSKKPETEAPQPRKLARKRQPARCRMAKSRYVFMCDAFLKFLLFRTRRVPLLSSQKTVVYLPVDFQSASLPAATGFQSACK